MMCSIIALLHYSSLCLSLSLSLSLCLLACLLGFELACLLELVLTCLPAYLLSFFMFLADGDWDAIYLNGRGEEGFFNR